MIDKKLSQILSSEFEDTNKEISPSSISPKHPLNDFLNYNYSKNETKRILFLKKKN